MKVEFLTPLHVEKVGDDDRWRLVSPFIVTVDGNALTVPNGFEHDFASVPRIPLAYLLAGNTAHKSAVVHDYLYGLRVERKYADNVFKAAMKAEGVALWRRQLMYSAVRMFGGTYYQERADHPRETSSPG